jgi:hypothetical protein
MKLLNERNIGFYYPKEFLKIIDRGLVDFEPWVIIEGAYLDNRLRIIRKNYPDRKLIPFARRLDNDDLACWEINEKDKVYIIHDFASIGWENKMVYENFWSWFKSAINDMIEYIG